MDDEFPRTARRDEETRRVARILDVIQKITAQPRTWTRRRLAESYEIGERQIQKDLQIVRHGLLLPLQRAHRGGYYFETIPRLPALSYTLPEGLALLLAVQAGRRVPGVNSAELAAAVARLESIFPAQFLPLLQAAAKGPPAVPPNQQREATLAAVCKAITERKIVRMVYASASRGGMESERLIEPYRIVPHQRSWQVAAYCHLRGEPRLFKVDRIRSIELTDRPYETNPNFDFTSYMGAAWGIYRAPGSEPEEVELLFSPAAGRRVAEEDWHDTQEIRTLEDGSVLFRVKVPLSPDFINWILQFSAEVRVLRPERLREVILGQARAVLDLYSPAPVPDEQPGWTANMEGN